MLVRHVKTDSPEPKSSVYVQNRCAARQWERNHPSTFSHLPSQPPSLIGLPSALRGRAAREEPSCSARFLLPENAGSLARLQAFDHCTQQRACPVVLFTSLTRGSESQGHTGDFPGFIDLYSPRGLQHIFGSCVQSALASAVWETLTEGQWPYSFPLLKCATGFHMRVSNTIQGVIYRLLSSPTAVFSSPRCSHF